MLAKDLIDRLERLGLLDQEIIEALRQQLDQGGSRVTPEAVAKLLVDNGQLTTFQASKLIGELRSSQYDEPVEVEEVDLTAGLDVATDVEMVSAVDDDDVFGEAVAVEAVPMEAVPVEAMPVESGSMGTMGGGVGSTPMANRPQPTRRKPPPQKSVWDSFKVYGYLGIIALLLVVGGALYFILSRESVEAVIGDANAAYEQQNYEAAQGKYVGFLESFGEETEYSSLARTRIVMTQLYKAATFKQEPEQGVTKARELLPTIADEKGMNEERNNLAQLLVEIAQNIATAAGKAGETSRKEELLATLDQHSKLMENPQYMSSTSRVALEGQIKSIEEARAKVQRDISRNRDLDIAEAEMIASLKEQKTKDAYDTRKALLRDYPELYDHERLSVLIAEASDTQQKLVSKTKDVPETSPGQTESKAARSIVLTSLAGREAPDLRGQALYLRAGGSVLAFDGYSGKLKWRKFVGSSDDLPPVGVEDGLGVLLSESSTNDIIRCDAETGDVIWRARMREPFSEPVVVKSDVFVATDGGRLISMDADSGDAKWATLIPQGLETGPGVDGRLRRIYMPGNHSNLYVINAQDGTCVESFYTGHSEGTIAVPPVPLFGHLFVIENAGTKYAFVHVLKVNEQGEQVEVAQDPIRLAGNVRVSPIIQGRRLIVLTDLGEVKVLDIELAAEGDKVSVVASLPPFYDEPTATEMAVDPQGSAMWITGTRVGRYKLQISTGQVIRDWSLHELDRFIGKPFIADDTLVYARVLRGTSATRVTAANPKTGEEIWRTDVGVPISMIGTAPEGGFHSVTSQAALFALDRESLASGSTKGPLENPGRRSVNIRFEKPVAMEDGRVAFLDEGGGETVLVYAPQRENEKLRQVTMSLPAGQPSGGMIYAGGGLFMPLTTGRAVLINWQTGAVIGAPFQPASDPAGTVKWTNPVARSDDPNQIIVADSRKKIYRLRVDGLIRELSSKDIKTEFLGAAASVNDTFIAGASGPAADYLVGHDMESLEEGFRTLLGGRIVWGPVATNDYALIKTDDGNLRAFGPDGSEKFSISIPDGNPVGVPVEMGEEWLLAGSTGWLLKLDASSGNLTGQSDLGQPLSSSPILVGKSLLVPGAEGVIYITEVPGN
ncbi:outer membrane biogenesis protein BamB [Rubripirellula amarantea]|uniref:Outer membrane biogenesis protein BamB n=1 Tax=Rubripirellula amarantea TaxID=2527999 RepID=A0A5C5WRX7_9BACT|nr:PQQ-binding-like beta-propeller repeat protein [Rubripirellula amarantea]TWT53298.1 outer membrane biogenesis protein BamB [Rubripirellula amarantea]